MENRRMSRNVFPLTIMKEDIVLSGIGGRYPESDSLDEFRDNLFNNVDMITGDDRRWPTPVYGMSPRMGKLKEIDKFDAAFFGVVPKVADEVDPQGRILLETTWEAIVDAGINPQSLRGSNTGVYVGYTSVAMPDGVPQEVQRDVQASKVESLLWFQGGSKAFYSNRISFVFDFHGPSMSIDVACASSMVCLDIALTDMRLGKCDQAIVAGVSINLQPFTNHIYQANNIGAPDGRSKVWDQNANGYVRGETVATIFLQKKSDSKRIYATVLHAKTNIDGYKISGMFFPSTDSQLDLMVKTYTEAGVNPLDVNYFEGHGTGTKAGDPQEAKAILEAYCKGRQGSLPVGLLKSNIGHGEGASGVASLSKLCIVYENKRIPANLNMVTLKADIAVMSPPLEPVTANRDYEPGIVGINSFGIGGVNAHALMKPNKKECTAESYDIAGQIPRLVNVIGRTEESVNHIFEFLEKNPQRVTREFLALLGETVNFEPSIYTSGFPYRGSMLIKKQDSTNVYSKKVSKVDNAKRPICYFFSGMGSQWSAMAKSLMGIDLFANAIQRCADILVKVNIDLPYVLLSEDPKALEEKIHHFVAITSMQIALVDVFKALGLEPDYIIGHSFGEIACAYADGCLSLEQAVITSYWRGKAIKDSNIEHGMMAAVGLSWEETVKRCPEGVYAACHNSIDSVTISGAYDKVNATVEALSGDKIFAREVACANIPFHSPLLQPAAKRMTEVLQQVIPQPKARSAKWISTSVAQSEWGSALAKNASPEYFVNNLINPVLFHDSSKKLPKDAIIIELAPHALFSAIFKRSMPSSSYVGLLKRNNNPANLELYLNAIGQLYQLGVNMDIKPLYPQVQWPVPRNTQSIGSLVKWDHNKTYFVKKYPEYHCQATASDYVQKFSLANPDDQFLKDHSFDGKCVLPATSYLLMVWRRLASSRGLLWYHFPVVFENVEFKRLTPMSDNEVKLTVRLLDPTGEFVVLDGGNVAASGRIYCPEEEVPFNYQHLVEQFSINDATWAGHKLDMNEFYTELNVRGFDYGPKFKQVQSVEYSSFEQSRAEVRWENNWVSFMESMIQLYATHTTNRSIHVALSLPSLKCDPRALWGSTPANVSVVTDANLKCVVAKGIEMKGLKFANIPLKNVMRDVKMEKYEFVPFNEPSAIEDVDSRELQQYIDQCNLVTERITSVLQKGSTSAQEQSDKLAAILRAPLAEAQVLLKLLVALYKAVFDENGNIVGKPTAQLVRKIIEENSLNLSQDLLNSVTKNSRLMRSTLDIVSENNLRNMTVIEANYDNGSVGKDLQYQMGFFFHYPLVFDYTLAAKDTKSLPKEVQNMGFQLVDWNAAKSTLPTLEAPADMLVYKDSAELSKLNLSVFTKDIADNVKEGGFVFAIFRSQLCKAEALLNNLADSELSTTSLRKRITDFEAAAKAANLQLVCRKSNTLTSTCLLLRKAFAQIDPTKQGIVEVKFGYFDEWVDKLKNTFTEYKNKPKNENVWMVSDDNSLNGVLGLMNCLKQEPGGDRFRCIYSATKLPRPVDFTKAPYKELLQKDLQMNVFKDNQWGSYRLLNLEKDYNTVQTNEAYADVVKKGDLSSVKWFELSALENIKPNQCNVKVNYSGLDYKDFLLASGSLGTDYVERPIGTEFAGRRSDNGKRVMGISCSKAIATSIDVNPQVLVDIPNNWTLQDGAASINSLFLVWYSLINRAQLEEGETILIHPATSANGLMAIQICQRMDCRILATASSEEKRNYLINNCGIAESNIFDPNEANFVDEILSLTAGNGVDVVFDSMSTEKLVTTFPIVSNYGRYIEVDNHTSSPNGQMRRNTHYYNISSLISEDSFDSIIPKLIKGFTKWFTDSSKYIKPVTRNVFRRGSIDHAFNALNSKEVIGKVLVQIRDAEESQPLKIQASIKSWFDPAKSYILVGGLGGLGLEVAWWMVTRGAKKLVLVSRSGIKNDYQYIFVKRVANILKSNDVQVAISTSDPTSIAGAEKLIAESEKLGPCGGIFHFATVLSDAFIEDQTAAAFKKVCAPKMDALGYLDAVTRASCPSLDYFVAFSSQSSGRGFVGQNNYGYANSVMEHICENRRRDGLPGQAIQYGPIGDVGLWAQNDHIDLTSIGMVINTQRIPSCMEVLDRFLSLPHAIVSTIVREEAAQQSAGGASAKNHIWQGIGIDMSSLPDNLTLGDVGMESILAVEMQQRIEREYEVNLTTDEIKQITVGQIKEYQTDNKATIKEKIAEFKKSLKK